MTEQYDVAILGAGFEGSMMAAILAYKGYKTVMLDAGVHPRYALGESTVRHTFRMMKIIAERFGVPEFKTEFYSAEHLHKHVSSNFGRKTNFGFLYHHPGEHQRPEESTQLAIPPLREGHEAHLFRQDTDAYLAYVAAHHGTTVKYMTRVKNVEADQKRVLIETEKGDMLQAKFVIDASGGGHVLSKLWDLRDNPPRVRLQSRCLYGLMMDVKPYDDLSLPNGVPHAKERWYDGTCHHIFDGGWMWVIPFNNRPGSTNKLVSVGVSFDMRKFPKPTDMMPDEEWREFLSRFPSVAEQFKDAVTARPWTSSDRLQVSTKQTVGARWALMAGGAGSGFLDGIFSRGLASSMEIVNALASRLLVALKEDDFSEDRLQYVARVHEINLQNNGKTAFGAYVSWKDFDLWNAYFRVWVLGVGLGDLKLASIYRRYLRTHDDSILPDAEEPMGLFYSQHEGYKEIFESTVAKLIDVDEGRCDTKSAAKYIFGLVQNAKFNSAANHLGDPDFRFIDQGAPITMLRTLGWLVTSAPKDIRDMGFSAMAWGAGHKAAATSA